MKLPDSLQDKAVTVNTFINARLNKIAKITSYIPMVTYLNGNHIQVLYDKLPKTAQKQELRKRDYGSQYYATVPIYDEYDAQMYLEWLISVVQSYEQASEEIRSKAYDQLCRFILILTDVTEWQSGTMLSKPYDWVDKLEQFEGYISQKIANEVELINKTVKNEVESFNKTLESYEYKISGYDKQLNEICETLDQRSKDMLVPIEQILAWLKEYSPTIEAMKKEYSHIVVKSKVKKN